MKGPVKLMPTPNLKSPVLELRVALTTSAFGAVGEFLSRWARLEPAQVWPETRVEL